MMKEFIFADIEKKVLFGPFLIPNKLIYRKDEQNGEYYVRFSSSEIKKIAEKFNEQSKNKEINLMHTDQKVDAFVFENWVIDGADDKSKNYGFDLPEGTWFGGVKVKDDQFWSNEVKAEKVKGFSVEILANLELKMTKIKTKTTMKREEQLDLGSTMLGDGSTPIYYDGDQIVEGTAIFTDEAMTMPAKDDRWVLEDGRTIVVVGGVVTKIEESGIPPVKMADAAPMAPASPISEAPQQQNLTAEEVTLMIDSRYQELMDEITQLKTMIGDNQKDYQNYKKQVEEKFSQTPATVSIKEDVKPKPVDKFSIMEQRVREFAKIK